MSFSQPIPGHEHGPSLQASPSGLEEVPGYVKNKIKSNKKRYPVSRARAWRLTNRAAKKLAEIPDEYLDRALRRLGEQLDATKPMWDVVQKKMIDLPDERIRQDAALTILAYKWGKPVEQKLSLSADATDFPELLRRLQQSEAAKAIEDSSQKTVEGKEIPPALPDAAREQGEHALTVNSVNAVPDNGLAALRQPPPF